MRIIAGKHRGRKLLTPKDDCIRPTTDFIREALFNILGQRVLGATVLDLFGGTGALALESLSRGATAATVCDASRDSVSLIKRNAEAMGEHPVVLLGDYAVNCKRLWGQRFDLVFLDPPYALKESYQNSINALLFKGLLNKECAIVLEYEGELDIDSSAFASRRDYTYGKTKVILLRDLL